MNEKREITVSVYRTTAQSWLASIGMMLMPVAISIANHRYGGGSSWIDAMAVLLTMFWIFALTVTTMKHGASYRGDADGAIAWLEKFKAGRECE